jgi:hypothetical protein
MVFVQTRCVFEIEDEAGLSQLHTEEISINVEDISAFSASNDKDCTTVEMKGGTIYEIICAYERFASMIFGVHGIVSHTMN